MTTEQAEECERSIRNEAEWWRKSVLFWMAVQLDMAKVGGTIDDPVVATLNEAFGGTPAMMIPNFHLEMCRNFQSLKQENAELKAAGHNVSFLRLNERAVDRIKVLEFELLEALRKNNKQQAYIIELEERATGPGSE